MGKRKGLRIHPQKQEIINFARETWKIYCNKSIIIGDKKIKLWQKRITEDIKRKYKYTIDPSSLNSIVKNKRFHDPDYIPPVIINKHDDYILL